MNRNPQIGNLIDCHVTRDDGTRVRVQAGAGEALAAGQKVGVRFDRHATSVFEA